MSQMPASAPFAATGRDVAVERGRPGRQRRTRDAEEAGSATESRSSTARQGIDSEIASPRSVFRAWVLLLLDERPGHGYDVLIRLKALGVDPSQPGRIYRSLRWLESAGLARPMWETSDFGPARRVYDVTPEGRRAVEVAAHRLRQQAEERADPLGRYMLDRLQCIAEAREAFAFTIKANLVVHALDRASAQRRVEYALAQPHLLGPNTCLGNVSVRPGRARSNERRS